MEPAPDTTPVIVGLDISLRSTGYATPEKVSTIRTRYDPPECYEFARERVAAIVTDCRLVVDGELEPAVAVLEGPSFRSHKPGGREVTELRGVVRLELWKAGVPTIEVPPKTLKLYATGSGKASKDDMVRAAARELGYEGSSDDEADATWLRRVGLDFYQGLGNRAGAPPGVAVKRAEILARYDWPNFNGG